MDKETYEKLLATDFKSNGFEPETEEDARLLSEIGLRAGLEEPEDILKNNYCVRELLEKKYGEKFRAEERDKEIQSELVKKQKLRQVYGDLSEGSLYALNRARDALRFADSIKEEMGAVKDPEEAKKTRFEKLKKVASFLAKKDEDKKAEKETDEWYKTEGKEKYDGMIKEFLAELKQKQNQN